MGRAPKHHIDSNKRKAVKVKAVHSYKQRIAHGVLTKQSTPALLGTGDARAGARTNLSSALIALNQSKAPIGEGSFRIAYGGMYLDGKRVNQTAVCKCFKNSYRALEDEFFRFDFAIAQVALFYAQQWNETFKNKRRYKPILITHGDLMTIDHTRYLVEPYIRYFEKFTSNTGWIKPKDNDPYHWKTQMLEAFCHFTYHRSGGQLIVCDLQGHYRHCSHNRSRSRLELSDPAVCSRRRDYGPTDMGAKGMETFFANHVCNAFCQVWSRPRAPTRWFDTTHSHTSMLRTTATHLLQTTNRATFTVKLEPVYETIDWTAEAEEDTIVPMKRKG